jgi:type II secretory pathway pseudopilin PulG
MMRGTKGFSLIEVLIAATTLVVIVLMILPQLTKHRQSSTKLQAISSCNQLADYFLSNISSRKAAVPIRTYFVTGNGQVPNAGDFTGDLLCNSPGAPSVCDQFGHFSNAGGALQFENYQNIRSAATWAGYRWNTGHGPGNCTAVYNFSSAPGAPVPLANLATFLPQPIPAAELNTLLLDAATDRRVDNVRFEITQIGVKDGGLPIVPAVDCAGGVGNNVRPNKNLSFDIKVSVDYRNRDLRGPAAVGSANSCSVVGNISYGFDRDVSSDQAVNPQAITMIAPATFITSLPTVVNSTCNPTATGPGLNQPAGNSPDARVMELAFSQIEAGSIAICKATIQSGAVNINRPWDLCTNLNLSADAVNILPTVVTPATINASGDKKWSFRLRWGDPAGVRLPLNTSYTVTFRAVDTAKNCIPGGPCPNERTVSWSTQEYCPEVWLRQFCPGDPDEVVPSGCGTNCIQSERLDFSATCPAQDSYFACEDRCGRCTSITGGTSYPSCVTDLTGTLGGNRPGLRTFTRVVGDNFCPPQDQYCPGVVQQVPCGGVCPGGTKDDRDQFCPGEPDSCGNNGTKVCSGPGGSRDDVLDGGIPTRDNGCGPNYIPYCPPTNTYCGNTVFLDQCGVACPAGTAAAIGCCDRCNSALQNFEDEADCMNPANYVLPQVPPASCNSIRFGAPGTGQAQCFVPN